MDQKRKQVVDAEKFRKAAQIVEQGKERFSCFALNLACGSGEAVFCTASSLLLRNRYAAVFKPDNVALGDAWFGYTLSDAAISTRQAERVIALCLMAAMIETGDA